MNIDNEITSQDTLTIGEKLFSELKGIIEANPMLLQHYRDDFYKHDKRMLTECWFPGARALWVVNSNGTHFALLGVHQRSKAFARACFGIYRDEQIYWLEGGDVIKVSPEKADALINEPTQYTVINGRVFNNGEAFATVETETVWKKQIRTTNVKFRTTQLVNPEMHNLYIHLGREVAIDLAQSIWVNLGSITINDEPLTL